MIQFQRVAFSGPSSRRSGGLFAPVMWLGGVIATLAALIAGAVLAVFTAIAVALFALFAGTVLFFAGLAIRARRKLNRRKAAMPGAEGDIIEARKVDGAWVAYGWDRSSRG